MDRLEFDTLGIVQEADIDDVRVLSANRQVLAAECILTDAVYAHTNTPFIHKSLFTLSVGYHHYPHIYKYQTFSFFSFPLTSLHSLHLCLRFFWVTCSAQQRLRYSS